MIKKNIFIRKYDVAENKLTEAFIRFLSCLEVPLLNKLLEYLGVENVGKNISFNLQPKGEKSTPDAVIGSDTFAIYVEVKRTSPLQLSQLEQHAKFLLQNFARFKLLLVVSPDYYEIETVKSQWRSSVESHCVKSRFISWTEIWHILQRLKKQSKSKDRFLLSQFADYLKEEKVVIMTQSFREKDSIMWSNFVEWIKILEDMLRQDIRTYIQSLQPKWIYKSFSPVGSTELRLHFNTSKNYNYLKFYSGFYSGGKEREGWEEPCFYVGWELRSRHFRKLINTRTFKIKAKKLKKIGFLSWTPNKDFYMLLKIRDIAKKKTVEQQKQYIRDFIIDAIREFNKIKLAELI